MSPARHGGISSRDHDRGGVGGGTPEHQSTEDMLMEYIEPLLAAATGFAQVVAPVAAPGTDGRHPTGTQEYRR
jgi:hypothetical protein